MSILKTAPGCLHQTILDERKKREIDPTLTKLRELEMEPPAGEAEAHARAKIAELRQLIELLTAWYDDMNELETDRLVQLLAMGAKLQKALGRTESILPFARARKPEKTV